MTHPASSGEIVSAFAPATVANLGPGFDVLGLAVSGMGDTVHARMIAPVSPTGAPQVTISRITGTDQLPLEAEANTAGIAALSTLRAAHMPAHIELELHKGLPLCSGLGSSAASAVAAAFAVNRLMGSPLRKPDLLPPCLDAEEAVAGRHADNVAPALYGGLTLVRGVAPPDVIRLPIPDGLTLAIVTPQFSLSTRAARAALPQTVPLSTLVTCTAQIASLVSACYSGDMSLLARSFVDPVVTEARAALIPGAPEAMTAALNRGALGSSISGAGPSVFAVCRSNRGAQTAGQAMQTAFEAAGLTASVQVTPAQCPGVTLIRPTTP